MRGVGRALLLAALVAACATPPAATFRDPGRAIYSAAMLDPARLAGRWTVAAAFLPPGTAACARGAATIGTDLALAMTACDAGRPVEVAARLVPSGPGRLTPVGAAAPFDGTWWVLWVDEGYRTLAIGTPGGGFGLILDRTGDLPGDRLTAAAQVFDFNGYDTRRLRRLR